MPRVALATPLAVALMLVTSVASADIVIGAEADLAIPVGDSSDDLSVGYGFLGRFGIALGVGPIEITPEIGGGYQAFPVDELAVYTGAHLESAREGTAGLGRAFVGGRVALDKDISPAVYARVGLGYMSTPGDDYFGPTLGGGLALEFRYIPLLNLGVHVGYDSLILGENEAGVDVPPVQWVALGAHVALQF
ncbi:hypothetical protein [Chondromyces apiculatus]|nr:hypothetical protein [Chondromyces apiculatus]